MTLVTQTVGLKYERALTGGLLSVAQLHAGFAEDAKKMLNGDMTIGEIRAKLPIMTRELENSKSAAGSTKADILNNPKPGGAKPYSDGDKEARYQKWKAEHASQ